MSKVAEELTRQADQADQVHRPHGKRTSGKDAEEEERPLQARESTERKVGVRILQDRAGQEKDRRAHRSSDEVERAERGGEGLDEVPSPTEGLRQRRE